jgi:hypothetical protein
MPVSTAHTPTSHPLRPTPLERAHGFMAGDGSVGDADPVGGDPVAARASQGSIGTPLAALEDAILPALARPPCLVTFSGGRDSSLVLAAAVRAARSEGLDPPIPITLRFSDAPQAEETAWQEQVIAHLGLEDWEVREVTEEADMLGPISTRVMRRHGVLFPANAFLHAPLFEAAAGGSLLTGYGGDHLFLTWRSSRLADMLAGRRRPVPRDGLRLAYATCPRPLRRWRERRRIKPPPPSWLRPTSRRAYVSTVATEFAQAPVTWSRWIRWRADRRDLACGRWTLGLLADDAGASVAHPLIDPRFVATLARVGGRTGFGDRTAAMRALFAAALPPGSLERASKARFDQVFWREPSRRFAESWEGSGVDADLVDPTALRREWLEPAPDHRSAMLLQSAWLGGAGGGAGDPTTSSIE